MVRGGRAYGAEGYSDEDTQHLLRCIHDIMPCNAKDWKKVLLLYQETYVYRYQRADRTVASIRGKFNALLRLHSKYPQHRFAKIAIGIFHCIEDHKKQENRNTIVSIDTNEILEQETNSSNHIHTMEYEQSQYLSNMEPMESISLPLIDMHTTHESNVLHEFDHFEPSNPPSTSSVESRLISQDSTTINESLRMRIEVLEYHYMILHNRIQTFETMLQKYQASNQALRERNMILQRELSSTMNYNHGQSTSCNGYSTQKKQYSHIIPQ